MNKIPVSDITPKNTKEVETYDLYAKREHIYVKFYKGIFKNFRIISGAMMLVLFYGSPWLQWNDHQAILFDLPNRQFHVFNATFWPQDFMLLSGLLIILTFILFVVTVFAGRLWCGYACPQFVWTWLFIWAERVTEGDRNQRMKQDKKPMTKALFLRKTAKHSIWFLLALSTALAFVGYFTPIRELTPSFLNFDLGPWEFWWIGFIAVATYGNAGWLREQVCIYMCPYARFQSVMFDSDTLIISYDEKRGENRGKRSRKTDQKAAGLGDCIDCYHCVNVCPTGIDIRDGLQIECVACGACVDACDDIMTRIGYDKGLIKYTTENQLNGGETKIIRPKLMAYTIIVTAMIGYFGYIIFERIPIEVDVHRDRNQLFIEVSDQIIENIYTLKVANKSNMDLVYTISVSGIEGIKLITHPTLAVKAGKLIDYPIQIQASTDEISKRNTNILIKVMAISAPQIQSEIESRFIAPAF
ncbi:MAG: cytochrome c oxidase accessory protein CcoG [Oceanospirillaceae bacterium]|nr:cytochrome c oxidase accessory protein CcoG [Oceanospirillaceae bacterium]